MYKTVTIDPVLGRFSKFKNEKKKYREKKMEVVRFPFPLALSCEGGISFCDFSEIFSSQSRCAPRQFVAQYNGRHRET